MQWHGVADFYFSLFVEENKTEQPYYLSSQRRISILILKYRQDIISE